MAPRVIPTRPAVLDAATLRVAERRYSLARSLIDSALTIAPRSAEAYALRARLRMRQGQLREAWSDAEVAGRLGSSVAAEAITAMVELKARDTVSARARVKRLSRSLAAKPVLSEEEGAHLAMALAAVGDSDGATKALARVRRPVSPSFVRALQDPVFDRLRGSARYSSLVRSLGQAQR